MPAPGCAARALAPAAEAARAGACPTRRRGKAAIVQAFEADRIELHLQPVVSLPQRKVQLYEAWRG